MMPISRVFVREKAHTVTMAEKGKGSDRGPELRELGPRELEVRELDLRELELRELDGRGNTGGMGA